LITFQDRHREIHGKELLRGTKLGQMATMQLQPTTTLAERLVFFRIHVQKLTVEWGRGTKTAKRHNTAQNDHCRENRIDKTVVTTAWPNVPTLQLFAFVHAGHP